MANESNSSSFTENTFCEHPKQYAHNHQTGEVMLHCRSHPGSLLPYSQLRQKLLWIDIPSLVWLSHCIYSYACPFLYRLIDHKQMCQSRKSGTNVVIQLHMVSSAPVSQRHLSMAWLTIWMGGEPRWVGQWAIGHLHKRMGKAQNLIFHEIST